MASTKKTTVKRSHERAGWVALALILLLLLLGFMAAYYGWWPFRVGTTTPTTTNTGITSGQSGSSGTTGGGSSTSGTNGTNGSNGSNGSAGGTTVVVGSDIFNLYGSVSNGQTKAEVQAHANGLSPQCSGVNVAQLEVCTYTEGNKVVTVSYQNGQVVAVSKSGF